MLGFLYDPREVSTYDVAFLDGAGAPLDGSNRYVVHLARLPPVNAFWSLSMYSAKTFLLVEFPINRYSIGDRTRGIVYGADGSLDIFIQHHEPADATEKDEGRSFGFGNQVLNPSHRKLLRSKAMVVSIAETSGR